MKTWKPLAALCTCAALAAACGSSSSSGPGASTVDAGPPSTPAGATTTVACIVEPEGTVEDCSLFRDVPESSVATLQGQCTTNKGSMRAKSCPTANVVGSCTSAPADGSPLSEIEYAYSTASAMSLQAQCAHERGTWSGANGSGGVDAGSVCSSLSRCCNTGHFTSIQASMKSSCTSAVTANSEPGCESQLVTLTAEGICVTQAASDAGAATDAGGPCASLQACCASPGLSSQVKSICQSDGTETDPSDCTGTLNSILADGDCKNL